MSLHKEISFETEICEHLAANGWLYADGDAAHYYQAHALFPADVLAWVQARLCTHAGRGRRGPAATSARRR